MKRTLKKVAFGIAIAAVGIALWGLVVLTMLIADAEGVTL